MALLTADDVLEKEFELTKYRDGYKFREGYNSDEVDTYLDQVAQTLNSLYAENEELKAKLEASERRVQELSEHADAAPPQGEPLQAAAPQVEQPEEEVAQPEVEDHPTRAAQTQGSQDATAQAASIIAMAQKLHDEYVSEGQAENERLRNEAQEESDRILGDARNESARIVREAEDQHNRTLTQLEQERAVLDRKIDELRTFERDYRTRLKSYLTQLLQNVEGNTTGETGI